MALSSFAACGRERRDVFVDLAPAAPPEGNRADQGPSLDVLIENGRHADEAAVCFAVEGSKKLEAPLNSARPGSRDARAVTLEPWRVDVRITIALGPCHMLEAPACGQHNRTTLV